MRETILSSSSEYLHTKQCIPGAKTNPSVVRTFARERPRDTPQLQDGERVPSVALMRPTDVYAALQRHVLNVKYKWSRRLRRLRNHIGSCIDFAPEKPLRRCSVTYPSNTSPLRLR
ncbi:uncharacterized protein TEOVI_000164800 [Trypanosoma equiperdum]|uniref:Uncharacterized protein n=1 Tax=Trypanosoma equiperdum TaxID=5694 RepID=A0A1G4IDI2_TRYEQ|nr:hypothetical protein, conserved [Trypanosoma equiperdum]